MNQLEMLWEYQQVDMEADSIANSIKRSPTRQKLVKLRDSHVEQQNVMKRIETEVANMSDRIDVLKDAIALTNDQIKTLQTKIENDPANDIDTVKGYIHDATRLSNNITEYEQEIRHIRKDATDRERQQHDVKVRAAKIKAEFDQLKVAYDAEYKEKAAQLEEMRKKVEEKAQGIEPDYMERYQTIKRHSVPPLAKLMNGQCGGCNMSLPSNVLRSIKAGQVVECETCGRMIIL